MLQNHILLTQSPTPTNRSLHPSPAKATPPPAKPSPTDLPPPAPLPLFQREQQFCEYLSQGRTFEAIAVRLSISPAAARAYHRRALSKRQRTIALASLEQGDSSARRLRKAIAKPEPASAEQPRDRLPFALALRERPNPLELCVPSLFVTGEPVAGCVPSQTTTSDRPRQCLRNRPSRCNGWAGVGDRRAAAS